MDQNGVVGGDMANVHSTPAGTGHNEPTDDEDLPPEMFKIKITDDKVRDKTPVVVKEKKGSSSSKSRSPKRKSARPADFYVHYRELHRTDADAPFPYYCSRRLVKKSLRTRHDKSHHSEWPFACDEEGCNKRYKLQESLVEHKKFVHSSPEQLPYVCMICEKRFFNELTLKSHSIVHSTIKDFCCLMCGYAGKRLRNLIEHVSNSHVNEKVACPLCHKIYSRQILTRHLRLHEFDNKFYCSFCECPFDNRNSYIDHLFLPEHIETYEQKKEQLDIPRCVPIASKDEWHDQMFFQPSDPLTLRTLTMSVVKTGSSQRIVKIVNTSWTVKPCILETKNGLSMAKLNVDKQWGCMLGISARATSI